MCDASVGDIVDALSQHIAKIVKRAGEFLPLLTCGLAQFSLIQGNPYTHLVTADDVRVAGELGALLDKEFFAQDLPKFPPNRETASGELTEAVKNLYFLGCGGWI